ncbi:uncharacterized protein LOC593539 [Strongylocentrotus purpuratus]|uniref:Major facilitator superfamily (MFS) profile domain-containing protein n=1 Tax=Strongylocentrotus purpuratus TaxID=7668 RepID=A0A7M7RGL7_STRPU|nr:uncharacterized protein LOC593539 [Strongylocentrotus purpuratus]
MSESQAIGSRLRKAIEWLRDRWGWIVTVASFVLYFITIGVLYCYGLIFISLQEEFKSSATITGWIGSLAWAISTLTSPLTAILLRYCQTRSIALLGIIFCSSSLLISSYVTNVFSLFATFSVMYGMGINFAQHSTLCLILTYFPKRNSTRTISFALTGCQVGLLALNPLMAFFVATKGWRLALRIFSGIVFLPGVISCIILLPPRKKSSDSVSPQTGERLALYHVCERDQGSGDHNNEKSSDMNDDQSLSGDGQVQIVPPKDQGDSLSQVQGSKPVCRFCVKSREEDEDGELKGEEIERTAVEMKMSKNPVTYFFSVALATLSLAWTFFNVNLVSYTDSVGIPANHGSILLTILAGAEMVGKALLCIFGDHVPIAKVYIIIMCNVLSAVISCGMIFCKDFTSMISIAIGIGLMRAIFNTVPLGAGIEIFGTSRTTEASTLAMFSYGAGYLVGSVIPGGIYDLTGSYTLSLVCMATVFILSAVMFLVIPWRKRIHAYLIKTCFVLQGSEKKVKQGVYEKCSEGCRYSGSVANINIDYL